MGHRWAGIEAAIKGMWYVVGPFGIKDSPVAADQPGQLSSNYTDRAGNSAAWKQVQAKNEKGEVDLTKVYTNDSEIAAYAYAEVQSPTDRQAQLAVGSDDTLTVWLNGKQVYNFDDNRGFEAERDRVAASCPTR